VTEPAFLIDSNICIYLLEGCAPAARARIEQCSPGEVVTSAVAFAEVMVGARSLQATAEAEALFRTVSPLPFDEEAGAAYARLPFRRGSFDRLIAAHALSLGLTLITNNPQDFADVPDLKVENWTKP